jgi:hypothetical protein
VLEDLVGDAAAQGLGENDLYDVLSIQIGIDLWYRYGLELTPEQLRDAGSQRRLHWDMGRNREPKGSESSARLRRRREQLPMTAVPAFASRPLAGVIVLLALARCGATGFALQIPAKGFVSTAALPPVEEWELMAHGMSVRPWEDLGAMDTAEIVWRCPSSAKGEGFSYSVHRFDSIRDARDGYRRALRMYRVPGYRADPDPDWSYDSPYADQYSTFCGGQETTPGNCYAVGRYANYVVVVALLPGENVGVEHLPGLFGSIDHHIRAVIDSAREP